jgi:hypothetical protein
MSTPVLAGKEVRTGSATARPYLLGGLAALSVGAAAIHFAVVFEHFAEYTLYGVFFLVISWARNAIVIAVYAASRTVGLPFGPDLHSPESVGALDVTSCVLEFGLIVGCAALAAVPVAVIAATTAVMTPGWAGPEGPAAWLPDHRRACPPSHRPAR